MSSWKGRKKLLLVLFVAVLALIPLLIACAGPTGSPGVEGVAGPQGAAGAAGTSNGTISGAVTNSLTSGGVAGVSVTLAPAISGVSVTSDSSGNYTASVPIGTYSLTFAKSNFTSATETVSVVAGQTATKNVALVPKSKVVVNAGADQTASIGGTVTLTATAEALDGSTVTGYQWTQTEGATAPLTNDTTSSATATLGDTAAYRSQLISSLETLNRLAVQAVNPHSLEAAETATFQVTVTTSSGSYTDTVNVAVALPFATVNGGIRNVPTKLPVLLHGKDQASYGWSITTKPSTSAATLDDPAIQNPSFTPDVAGKYTLTEATSGATIDVFAGTWTGVITGQDANGLPVADSSCTTCHNGTIAPDKFTAWAASGHAEIFSSNLNTSTYYGEGCFSCHTVGFDKDVSNGGFDDASDYTAFLAAGILNKPSASNWTNMLASYPNAAKLANIQCESCHGPQSSQGHTQDSPRVSLSSDVCGACHGEPARHGRFQQWEESGHGNFELAIEEGLSTSCARCHSAQGFLAWLPRLEAGNSGSLPSSAITWTADTVQPQTCVTCHDPHEQGTTSGEPNTATLRVEGDTAMLPAGFQAVGVGKGALCMTCHNTRNGARNDVVTTTLDDRAPHVAAQADVLMGQNAYLVTVGQRSSHSFIEDTCVTCHMGLTSPPAEFSYNLSGTNHAFGASMEICASCHGEFNGGTLQESVESMLEQLQTAIEQKILSEIDVQIALGNAVALKGLGAGGADVPISSSSAITSIELVEFRGRQAMEVVIGGVTYDARLATDTKVGTSANLLSSTTGQKIAKAGWDYFLIHSDGSEGVHNPSFAIQVLNAAIAVLK